MQRFIAKRMAFIGFVTSIIGVIGILVIINGELDYNTPYAFLMSIMLFFVGIFVILKSIGMKLRQWIGLSVE